MAYRCILNNLKECDGCMDCEPEDSEENKGLAAQQIGDAEKEQELMDRGII